MTDSETTKPQLDYQLLFNINPQPMWICLQQSRMIMEVNQAALGLYGYSRAEFLKLSSSDLIAGAGASDPADKQEFVFAAGTYKHQKKTGEVLHMQIMSSITDVNGHPAELVICTDVTQKEARWQALNEKYRDTQKIAQLGYWCRNIGDSISDWSEEMYIIFGRDSKSFTASYENLMECVHPDDRYLLNEDRFSELSESGYKDFTHRIITQDNETRWVFQRLQLQTSSEGRLTGVKGIVQDITEKEKTDQKFKAIFDNTTDAIVIGDDQGQCMDHNSAAAELFGYTDDELKKMNLHQLLNYPAEKLYFRIWKRFLNGKTRSGTLDLQRKDGTQILVDFKARPAIMPGVNLCVFSDVTAQLRQRQQLETSEKRFKALVQEGADLIAILDRDGKYLFASGSHFRVTGKHAEYYIGKNAFDFTHSDDKEAILELFSTLAKNKQVKSGPFRMLDSDGNWKWLTAVATDLSDDPAVGGIIINSKEITDDVLNLIELKLSNERFRMIMKASNEAIFDWNIASGTVEWGIGFQEVFGYDLTVSNNHLLSENIFEPDLGHIQQELAKALHHAGTEMMLSECRYHKANGDVVPVAYRIIFLRDQAGVAIRAIGSIMDITPYKQSLLTVQIQNEQLRQIAYAQSHIVRAPLSRIMALINLIRNYPGSEDEKDELISGIHIAALELDQVIRDISDKTSPA